MIYTLKNNNYKIQVNSLGAELKSFLLNNEEYLYNGDTTYWHRSSPVLFPIVGRLKNNNYSYKNKNYRLPIHGFARFYEFELIEQSQNTLMFKLTHNKQTLKYYPFKFELYLTYILNENGLEINHKVKSEGDILFSLGAHPAFLIKASINNSFISFEKEEKKDALPLNLDYGCICDEKRFTLEGNKITLHDKIFEQDALIFKKPNSKKVTLGNDINAKKVILEFPGFEYIAFWAPVNAPFVCLEPWCGIADHINTDHNLETKTSIIKQNKDEIFDKSIFISLK